MSAPGLPPDVEAAFAAFPASARAGGLALRDLVFEVAARTPEAGPISEDLRWGEPAYLTAQTRSGTTIRIGAPKTGGYGLFVNCRTSLIEEFREMAPHLRFDGRRGVLFADRDRPDRVALAMLIRAALTYHLRKA
ncbi:DUF1801 domain-containing protein [Marimonas arenosa]|uniref:DUF1801 domain-containing protein n=1 Tax=Marimonas arenosa TaxID=1795305 RepID=A0AAE4B415_9RHOB|nr:DUF1801 domain-containing protein [Marimonas arenosa]MDQ2089767.1 DUF1801 domain-containing protein [Marimonas arenosa]